MPLNNMILIIKNPDGEGIGFHKKLSLSMFRTDRVFSVVKVHFPIFIRLHFLKAVDFILSPG